MASEHVGMVGPLKAVRMLLDESGVLVRAEEFERLQAENAALTARLAAAEQPMPNTYACEGCGRRDGLDCVVASDVWERIRGGLNLLCLWCIDARCSDLGINTTASLHFAGRAITGTTQSAADEEHIRRACAERDEAVALAIRLRDALERVVEQADKVDRDELIGLDAMMNAEDIARAALAAAASSAGADALPLGNPGVYADDFAGEGE